MIITKDNWNATRWPNFTPEELACKHCGALEMDADFLDNLELLRYHSGYPIIITSGYRCPNHPAELAKKTTGAHVQGKAIDMIAQGQRAFEIIAEAISLGFNGIGVSERDGNPRFIHLDRATTLPRPSIWSY